MMDKVALRVLHSRLAKRFDTIADGLDPGQRRTSTRKHFQEQPKADGPRHGGRRRQGSYRQRVPTTEQRTHQATTDGDQECPDKEVGGDRGDDSGLSNSWQVDHGNDEKNPEANRHSVRQKRRNRRNEGSNARGNTYRGGKNVIGRRCRRRQQARKRSKVVARISIGSAA